MSREIVTDAAIMAWVNEVRSHGDRSGEASARLFSFLREKMRAYAAQHFPEIVSAYADPSDVTQEALIRVDAGLDDFKGSTVGELIAFAQYKVLGKISDLLDRHMAKKHGGGFQRVSGSEGDELLEAIAARDLSVSSRLNYIEKRIESIALLPSDSQGVMKLLWVIEKSLEEISLETGISVEEIDLIEQRSLEFLATLHEKRVSEKSQ